MGTNLERARVLLDQQRYDLAEQAVRKDLAEDPGNPIAHAILAICVGELGRHEEALKEAEHAISLAPDFPYPHFVRGHVLLEMRRLDAALEAAEEAIRLDPEDADHFALLASVRLQQRRWAPALEAAERGLDLDAEHVRCSNLRALSLRQLGRKQEAGTTLDATLAKDPENALSHANQGWNYLDRGAPEKALEHFREALRIQPEMDWARQGIVTALRARYRIYALILSYYLWMSKLGPRLQWGLVIGGFFASRLVRSIARENPGLGPVLWPIFWLYVAFCLMSWIANPIFNLLLRLNRFGRLALTPDETRASSWIGGLLLAALGLLAAWAATGDGDWGFRAAIAAAMTVPVSATFHADTPPGRRKLAAFTIGLGAVAALAMSPGIVGARTADLLGGAFFLGFIVFQFVANAVLSSE